MLTVEPDHVDLGEWRRLFGALSSKHQSGGQCTHSFAQWRGPSYQDRSQRASSSAIFVALRISSGYRGEKSLNLGKFGIFRPRLLIGQPYGLSYEIQADRTLKVLQPRRLEELGTVSPAKS